MSTIRYLLFITSILNILTELRFVFEIFRHGARSPFLEGGKDVYEVDWDGPGELTPVGMRMHYLLGARNRDVYGTYLGGNYDPNAIYVMSTDTNRTIMSAYSQLQGLYPPSTGPYIQKEREGIAIPPVDVKDKEAIWKDLNLAALKYATQVVPIHTIPTDTTRFYLDNWRYCKANRKNFEKNLEKDSIKNHIKEYNAKYGEQLKAALKHLNETRMETDFEYIWELSDSFVAGYTSGKSYKILEDQGINLKEFNETSYKALLLDQFDLQYDDPNLFVGTMSMSPLHSDILNWMNTRIEFDKEKKGYVTFKAPKMVMLSGHDTNISAMEAYLFNVFSDKIKKNFLYPGFAASLYYELHRKDDAKGTEDSDYFVRIIFNDDKTTFGDLEFTEFKKGISTKSFSQEYINDYCGFNKNDSGPSGSLLFLTIILACITLTLIIVVVVMCMKRRNITTSPAYRSIV
jgi:hypothetical protein